MFEVTSDNYTKVALVTPVNMPFVASTGPVQSRYWPIPACLWGRSGMHGCGIIRDNYNKTILC